MAEYPRMLYHVNKGQLIVKNTRELQGALKRGWSKSPVLMGEAEALCSQIRYLEEQLETARKRLAEIEAEADTPKEATGG
jgi:hypothetical protein